jgi:cystathionine beta-lyase/cystathionine gamma-synthase
MTRCQAHVPLCAYDYHIQWTELLSPHDLQSGRLGLHLLTDTTIFCYEWHCLTHTHDYVRDCVLPLSVASLPPAQVLYVEAISNPLVQVPDLTGLADLARQSGVTSVIDATFASPALLRPAALGYDVVLHSATKYLNGHSDVIAGEERDGVGQERQERAQSQHHAAL